MICSSWKHGLWHRHWQKALPAHKRIARGGQNSSRWDAQTRTNLPSWITIKTHFTHGWLEIFLQRVLGHPPKHDQEDDKGTGPRFVTSPKIPHPDTNLIAHTLGTLRTGSGELGEVKNTFPNPLPAAVLSTNLVQLRIWPPVIKDVSTRLKMEAKLMRRRQKRLWKNKSNVVLIYLCKVQIIRCVLCWSWAASDCSERCSSARKLCCCLKCTHLKFFCILY